MVKHSPSTRPGLDTATLAEAKHLPPGDLQEWGIGDERVYGVTRVVIPYADTEGATVAIRYRLSLDGDRRFQWRTGDHVLLYGLSRLQGVRAKGWVLLVEGESDTWTGWLHRVPTLGIPGKSTWRPEWAELLSDLDVYLWQEPAASDLSQRVSGSLPNLRIIASPSGIKDISEAHIKGMDVAGLVEELRVGAAPVEAPLPACATGIPRHKNITGRPPTKAREVPGSIFDAVKYAVRVEELAERFTQLHPAGPGRVKGLCPLHDEKTPSFHIDLDKQLWHCFGACARGGDLFTLAQELMSRGLL